VVGWLPWLVIPVVLLVMLAAKAWTRTTVWGVVGVAFLTLCPLLFHLGSYHFSYGTAPSSGPHYSHLNVTEWFIFIGGILGMAVGVYVLSVPKKA
jgi:hypothetical protein